MNKIVIGLADKTEAVNTRPSKHFQKEAYDHAPPVPCMFYVEGNVGRICGDPHTEWDKERETWLCGQHRREMG